jgi:predicted regulator of Ras-like GTPase activity (Roadblock/LC7/MglB family)
MDRTQALRLTPEQCRAALEALLNVVPSLSGAVLSRSDGFEIASVTRGTLPVSRLAALSSSMVALGQASLRELGMNGGGSVLVEGPEGKLMLLEVPLYGQPMVLAAVGGEDVVTGKLLWAVRDCVRLLMNPTTTTGVTS